MQSQGFLSKSRKIIRAPAAARQYYKGHPLRRLTEGSSEIEMSLDGCSLPLPSNEVVSWVFSTGDTDTLWLVDGPFLIPIFPSGSFGMDHT